MPTAGARLAGPALATDASAATSGKEQPLELALFCDATECAFALADQRSVDDPAAPLPPHRVFVKNADEAHRIALEGPHPVVGMSLDDLLDCAVSGHPAAGDLRILAGVHRGFLQLVAAPGIARIADLKGRRVAIDTDTGYARALHAMLARAGLDVRGDLDIVYAGATNLRYEKLMARDFDATLLGAPFTRLAIDQGFRPLTSVIEALGGYQAIVLVARRPWLESHGAAARALVGSLTGALALGGLPQAQTTVLRVLRKALPAATPGQLPAICGDLFGPRSEFLRDGRMASADIKVVLDLFNAARGTNLSEEDVQRLVW